MTTLKSLEKFLLSDIASDLGKKTLDPDENLLEQSIIDSLGILKLVTFLEEAFGIQVIDEDIVPENFQSLNSMASFVEQKIKNR